MKKLLYFLFIFGMLLTTGCSAGAKKETLKLKGNKKMTVHLNKSYKDPGTNVDDCTVEGTVNTSKEGIYKLTYTYDDQKVTRTVSVVNPARIVKTINGSQHTFVKEGDPYIESGCHFTDKKDGDLTAKATVSGTVDTKNPGDYEITYKATNSAGYTAKAVRTVHVVAKDQFKANKTGVPVLMYHFVYTDKDKPAVWTNNYIKDTTLAEELKYLQSEQYYYPSWEELRAFIDGKISLPEKSIVLTFDDGRREFLDYGIPVLEKYKVPATSFVIAKNNGAGKVKKYASPYVSFQSHSYGMHTGGSGIGHGGIIFSMSKDAIVSDLKKCQKIVNNTQAFAYPYGDVSEDGKKAVEESGFLCAFNTHHGKVKPHDNPYDLTRIRAMGDFTLAQFKYAIK